MQLWRCILQNGDAMTLLFFVITNIAPCNSEDNCLPTYLENFTFEISQASRLEEVDQQPSIVLLCLSCSKWTTSLVTTSKVAGQYLQGNCFQNI